MCLFYKVYDSILVSKTNVIVKYRSLGSIPLTNKITKITLYCAVAYNISFTITE